MSKRLPSLILASLALLPAVAAAQVLDDPRAVGMGGAVRGDPVANSAVIYNPAGMSRLYTYAAEVSYHRVGLSEANAFGANIVDSKTQPSMAVGMAYGYEFTDSGAPFSSTGHNARLAFAHPVSPNRFNLGVGLQYIHKNQSSPREDLREFTMDAGAHLSFSPELHLGVVGHRLVKTNQPGLPREAGGGLAYTGRLLTVDFDLLFDFDTAETTKPRYMVGLELLLAETVPLRAGYERNEVLGGRNYISGGLGFMSADDASAGTQFNFAFRQDVDDGDAFRLAVGLTFYI